MSSSSNWIKINMVFCTMTGNVVNQRTARFGADDTSFEHDGLFFSDLHNVFGAKIVNIDDFVSRLAKIYPDEYVQVAQNEFVGIDWSNVCSVSIREWIGDGSDMLESIEDSMDDIDLLYNAREINAIWNASWDKWYFERYVEVDQYDKRMYQEDIVHIR